MKKGYMILAIGYEYNDEGYNITDSYEKPDEVFTDKDKAKEELIKQEIKSYRGSDLSAYMGEDGLEDHLAKGQTVESVTEYLKKEFKLDVDSSERYYEIYIPKEATDEQIKNLMKMVTLRFNELHEININ